MSPTVLIWNADIISIHYPFARCSYFIIPQNKRQMQTWTVRHTRAMHTPTLYIVRAYVPKYLPEYLCSNIPIPTLLYYAFTTPKPKHYPFIRCSKYNPKEQISKAIMDS